MVLQELHRAGVVQLLSDERVRVRSRTFRVHGVNASGMSEVGSRGRELLETLIHNLRDPDARILCDSMASIEVDALRVPVIRDLIARRAGNFLAAIEQELAIEASLSHRKKSKKRVRIGLTAFESEHWPSGIDSRGPMTKTKQKASPRSAERASDRGPGDLGRQMRTTSACAMPWRES